MALWTRTPSPGKTRNSPLLFLALQLETSSLQGSFWLQVGPVEAAEEGSAAETVSSVSDEVRFTTYLPLQENWWAEGEAGGCSIAACRQGGDIGIVRPNK